MLQGSSPRMQAPIMVHRAQIPSSVLQPSSGQVQNAQGNSQFRAPQPQIIRPGVGVVAVGHAVQGQTRMATSSECQPLLVVDWGQIVFA
jgi:hypothetical protein